MAIEFNGLPPSPQPPKTGGDAQVKTGSENTQAKHGESERPATAADKISLTDTLSRLQKLEQRLADLPVVDSQRVEALKKAIAEGSYKVDAERVAQELLALEGTLNTHNPK